MDNKLQEFWELLHECNVVLIGSMDFSEALDKFLEDNGVVRHEASRQQELFMSIIDTAFKKEWIEIGEITMALSG